MDILAAKSQCGVTGGTGGCVTAWPCPRRGRGGGCGKAAQILPWGPAGHPGAGSTARPGTARQETLKLPLRLLHLLATLRGAGRGRGCRLPGLSALFPAICQAPFPALVSPIRSFVPATALKRICGWSSSIPLLQGCPLLGPCGDLASLSLAWAFSALPCVLLGPWWDGRGTAQPFAEMQLQLRLLLLNKPPAGSSVDVRPWKYLYEGLEPAWHGPWL